MMDKKERLFDALAEFRSKKDPTVDDFMYLFIILKRCMERGGGFLWTDVTNILIDVGVPNPTEEQKGGETK